MVVTRFAPSPNGMLHIGHAWSAIVAHDLAKERGGNFLLRIEDIDVSRSLPAVIDDFRRDLEWLGLEWNEVPTQSSRLDQYKCVKDLLLEQGFLYPCSCSRQQIIDSAIDHGPEGPIYPGICKGRHLEITSETSLRLDSEKAMCRVGSVFWQDEFAGQMLADLSQFGDVVIFRKQDEASYHLAVTHDDAQDCVTLVTRGQDLLPYTHIHRVLQSLLELPVPRWYHHDLVIDKSGRKLSKSRSSEPISALRLMGADGRRFADKLRSGNFPGGISLSKA